MATTSVTQSIRVVAPEGVGPGEQFVVNHNGQRYEVVMPHDASAGDALTISVEQQWRIEAPPPASPPPPLEVEVVVPEGVDPGDQLLVTHAGQSFHVEVPDGCGPGSALTVRIPQPRSPLPAGGGEGEERARVGGAENEDPQCTSPPAERGSDPKGAATVGRHSPELKVASPASPPVADVADPLVGRAGEALLPKKKKGYSLDLKICGGLSISLAVQTAAKYAVGSRAEVLRSDGGWSACTVREYEWQGVTYTVALDDGRLKYMVEEEDLRAMPGATPG
jgi:hypothetical protein